MMAKRPKQRFPAGTLGLGKFFICVHETELMSREVCNYDRILKIIGYQVEELF